MRDGDLVLRLENPAPGVHRLRGEGNCWQNLPSLLNFSPEKAHGEDNSLQWNSEGILQMGDAAGNPILESDFGPGVGLQGNAWVLCLRDRSHWHFHGLGERGEPLDLRGRRFLCRNVDVWGEYGMEFAKDGNPDPLYLNIPWLLIGSKNCWVGILVNNPGQVFFSLAPDMRLHPSQDLVPGSTLYMGAMEGAPDLWFLQGNTPQQVAARLRLMLGPMPRPPLWALGHHQCRWGYGSVADLQYLHRRFLETNIPCDGLWLDIDYMDNYRVFTLHNQRMENCAQVLQDLLKAGRRVVVILDPGIADARDFNLCKEGLEQKYFCTTPQGAPFSGFVWPGRTFYPDFFLESTRTWWATKVQELCAQGFAAFWLDMNEPATGAALPFALRFVEGRFSHDALHNAYADAMALATRAGMLVARPQERPFLLSRSGGLAIGKLAFVWMGDNFSTWKHLQRSIPMALNLSLSGVPMVGADAGGFGGDAEESLMIAWYKAHFLFPFLRNHCVKNAIPQEPWALGLQVESSVGELIRWRYRLIPYLYQCALEHQQSGLPLLRTLHGYAAPAGVDWSEIEDQFLVGPYILQAPLLLENMADRLVHLPSGKWFSLHDGCWVQGPCTKLVSPLESSTPVWVAEKAVLPMISHPVQSTAQICSHEVEIHLFLWPSADIQESSWIYEADDGISFAYQKGVITRYAIGAQWGGGLFPSISAPPHLSVVVHGLLPSHFPPPRQEKAIWENWNFLGCSHPVLRFPRGENTQSGNGAGVN